MKKGKRALLWDRTRKKWLKENPPSFEGYYVCHICNRHVLSTEVTLDHVIPRSRKPSGLTDFSNIKPAHYTCNSIKGSKSHKIDIQ